MSDTKTVSTAKNSLITTRRTCPLCESKSRHEIDILCAEYRNMVEGEVEGDVVDAESEGDESDRMDAPVVSATLMELEKNVREMLGKLRDETEFTLADLTIHLSQHAIVTQFAGVQVRTEGNYLISGDAVYQKVDLKDSLNFFILKGLEQMAAGKMKMTAAAWINANALLWRMMGNAGADEFIQAMIEKTQKGEVDTTSPLGASFEEHQKNLAKKQARIQKEEMELEMAVETEETTA